MTQLSGRPLIDSDADAALFVNRVAELHRLLAAVRAGRNVVVHGDPGAGRTSTLRQATRALRLADGPPTLWIAGSELPSDPPAGAAAALDAVAAAVDAASGTPEQTLAAIAARLANGPGLAPVVIVDDLPPDAGNLLFGAWRDRLWEAGPVWVASVRTDALGSLLRGPASAFFEATIALHPLSDADSHALLAARKLPLTPDAAAQVVASGAGNPRRLLAAAGDLLLGEVSDAALSGFAAWRASQLAKLSAPAAMLMRELPPHEWVSASDPALQQRLGWTRARLAQVFKQLTEAGLVTSVEQRQGAGRPRRAFRPVQASEWREQG